MLSLYLSMIDTESEKNKFERLYEKYRRLMLYVARGILKNEQDAEDAVHEAFIRVIKNIDKIDEDNPAYTKNFLKTVVKNTSLTMLKNNSSHAPFEDIDDIEIEDESSDMDIPGKIEYSLIVESILSLPDLFRDIFYFKLVHEYSIAEISEALCLPVETVKKRLQRGRKILLERLEIQGVTANER